MRIGEVASGPGGIDSLRFIGFMFKIEEEFGVTVSDDDPKSIKTLADLERHVALKAELVDPPRAVMSNSFAFGGSNGVLVAQRP